MESSRSYNSVRNIGFGVIKQLITLALAFLSRTIFVRLLGAEYTGVSGLYNNILMVLSLAELGVGNVLVYSLYEPLKNKDTNKIYNLIMYFKKIYRLIAFLIMLIGVAFIPCLHYIVKSDLPKNKLITYYILYLLNSVMSYFIIYKSTLIQADQKIYIHNMVGTIVLIVQYVAQIIYLILTKNFVGYLIIQIICTLLQSVILNHIANCLYPYLKNKSEKSKQVIDSIDFKENIKSMFLYKIATVVINNTDNILISILLGTVFVGYYSNYFALTTYMSTFISLVITGMMASLGNLNAEKDSDKSYQVFKNLIFVFNGITCFCVVCYLSIVQDFIPIWLGNEYIIGYDNVIAIMFSFYIANVTNPIWMFRETLGLFKEMKYIMFATAILNIVLSVIFGKIWGMAGILAATGLARILTIVWYEPKVLFSKIFKKPVSGYFKQQLKLVATNLLLSIAVVLICSMFGNGIVCILIKIIICALIVCCGYSLLYCKTEEFKWIISKVISIFKRRLCKR